MQPASLDMPGCETATLKKQVSVGADSNLTFGPPSGTTHQNVSKSKLLLTRLPSAVTLRHKKLLEQNVRGTASLFFTPTSFCGPPWLALHQGQMHGGGRAPPAGASPHIALSLMLSQADKEKMTWKRLHLAHPTATLEGLASWRHVTPWRSKKCQCRRCDFLSAVSLHLCK